MTKDQKINNRQDEELERVGEFLAAAILDWFNAHGSGHTFHLGEFTRDILMLKICAPDSPRRVMADLRKKGLLNYAVISRKDSLYRTMPPVEEFDWDGNMETVFDTDEL